MSRLQGFNRETCYCLITDHQSGALYGECCAFKAPPIAFVNRFLQLKGLPRTHPTSAYGLILEVIWEFQDYLEIVKELPATIIIDTSKERWTQHSQEHCLDFVNNFFHISIKMHKHFDKWRTPQLAAMTLAGNNTKLSAAIATWTLNDTLPANKDKTVLLPEHGDKVVSVFEFLELLSEQATSQEMKGHVMIKDNALAVEKMSQGTNLWSSDVSDVKNMAVWCKTHILPVSHYIHRIEAGVGWCYFSLCYIETIGTYAKSVYLPYG